MTRARDTADFGWTSIVSLPNRAALAALAADGRLEDGRFYQVGDSMFLGETGATVFGDIPGAVPAMWWTPPHWGAVGDGVTDDGAALNAALAAYRTAIEAVPDRMGAIVFDGLGKQYRSTLSLDWTHVTGWCWNFRNLVIRSAAEGLIAWDETGTRGGSYSNFFVYGEEDAPPAYGIYAARSAAGGSNGFADIIVYHNCGTRGFFSEQSTYFYARESMKTIGCTFWNSHPEGGCGIIAAVDLETANSEYETPITGAASHIDCSWDRTEWRMVPVSTSVVSFTATNPLTVTLASMPFENGQTVVFGSPGVTPAQMMNLKATITAVSGNTVTLGAVDATGWAAFSGTCLCYRAHAKPALSVAGGLRGHEFKRCYAVAYGADGIAWHLTDADTRQIHNIDMGFLFEGFGNRSNIRFYPGDRTMILRNFKLDTYTCRTREAVFSVEIAGPNTKVQMFDASCALASVMAPAAPMMFANPERFELYNVNIGVPGPAYHDPSAHPVFRGQWFRHDTGVLAHWAADMVGNLDWMPVSGILTKLNVLDVNRTLVGSYQFNADTQTWGFACDGAANDYFMTPAALYPNGDNAFQLGLSASRWSTGWFNITNTVTLSLGGMISYRSGLGIGGTFTQTGSKTTAVTANDVLQGTITTEAATSIPAGGSVVFEVNSNIVTAETFVLVQIRTAATAYAVEVAGVTNGRFAIRLINRSGGALAQAVPIKFWFPAHTVVN